MNGKKILRQIALADKSDLNYFEILGTDSLNDSQKSFPPAYFEYREEWKNRMFKNNPGNFPLHLDIESTNKCNLRCSMCQIDFKNMDAGFMDMSLYKRIIEECGENQLPSIKLNYRGEPTLNKKLVEMVRLAKDAGIIEVQFNTNGTLLTERLANNLIDAGLDRIKVSIDGATPEVYEKIRGVNYQKVVGNVKNFVRIRDEKDKIRPIVQVQMVYMQDNKDEAVKYVQLWRDVVNRIGFSRYRSRNRILKDKRRVEPLPTVTVPCSQLWQRMLVTFDGQILMCCGDHKALNPLGNIIELSLKEAWNSTLHERYRNMHRRDCSSEIRACSICEINRTDPENAERIWVKIRKNVQVQGLF
jgi:radical SAM protein with 4Fe4S-binding SPASM domain